MQETDGRGQTRTEETETNGLRSAKHPPRHEDPQGYNRGTTQSDGEKTTCY